MISLLKICEIKRWIPVESEVELPIAVLETPDGPLFAGFVSGGLNKETGPLETGTSKYAKGVKSYQTHCVQREFGKPLHLKIGGLDKINKALQSMKGFTKTYWSLRSVIYNLFKEVPTIPVTHLETYMRSKAEIMKGIKTKFAYENGGIFRTEEITHMNSLFHKEKEALETFLTLLANPTRDLAEKFDLRYAPVKAAILRCDEAVKITGTARARLLFPTDKKKSTIKFLKLGIVEKINAFSEEKRIVFKPESLPGIVFNGEAHGEVGSFTWRSSGYPDCSQETAVEVINSYYTLVSASEADD
jgi:hypothetical protein